MDNKSYEQFIILHAEVKANKQDIKSNKKDFDKKIMNPTEYFISILK